MSEEPTGTGARMGAGAEAGEGVHAGTSERARAATTRHEVNRGWYWLLLVPLIGTLIPPIYNSDHPEFIGVPFFYWYQMVWIAISVLCTVIVYRRTRGER